MPGKRLIAFGRLGDQEVVAKLFYEQKYRKRQCRREVAGVKALFEANIPTAKLLYQGTTSQGRVEILLFEKIPNATGIATLWAKKKSIEQYKPIIRALTVELATQHVLGILQRDLNLNNFLVNDEGIYSIDTAAIEKFEDYPLDKKLSLDYLGLFFVQLGVGTEELQSELLAIYAKARGWIVRKSDLKIIQEAMNQAIRTRIMRFRKKLRRSSTAFKRMNHFNKTVMFDREYLSDALMTILKNPEIIFQQQNKIALKAGRSASVAKFTLDNRTLVVKRYNIKNKKHWARRCLRRSRAAHCWQLAQQLRMVGISTARPVAYIENRIFGFRGKSYFIAEYVDGLHAGEYFANFQPDDKRYTLIAERILKLLKNLSEIRITHGDLKMTNILIEKDRPVLIDLDGMREHKTQFRFKHLFKKEIQRFMKNWEDQPAVHALFDNLMNKIE